MDRRIALGILPLLLLPVPAYAGDDCIMSAKDLAKLLPDKAPEFKGKVARARTKHGIAERVRLKAGGNLKVTQGGCAHYGSNYEISGLDDATALTDRKYYMLKMAGLLESLPGREGKLGADLAKHAREAIVNIPKANVPDANNVVLMFGDCSETDCDSSYSCGDATCAVTVKRIAKGKNKGKIVLSATYDFAL